MKTDDDPTIDCELLTHAHLAYQQLAHLFSAMNVPVDVMLILAALAVAAETEDHPLDDVLARVRSIVVELTRYSPPPIERQQKPSN